MTSQPRTQIPLPKSEKIERAVFIPKTVEDNQKALLLKQLAQKEKTTIHNLLGEAIGLLLTKRHLKPNGNPILSLLSFGTKQSPKQYPECFFHKCKEHVTYQAYHNSECKPVGLCKLHAREIYKPNTKNWPWKNVTHIDAPTQPLCNLCIEISTHTMLALPSNRIVPLCERHYHEVQDSIQAGNTKWRAYTPPVEVC
jgi:hypothetical protein